MTSRGNLAENAEISRDNGLDPADWPTYRAIAHKMLDEAMDLIEDVRDRPVWQPIPPLVKQALAEPLPLEPQGVEKTTADAARLILPYATGNIHPRFFGWVHGSGTAGGVIAEMLAAAMNSNVGGREHAAIHVERQVIDWCRRLFDFPDTASGLIVSGTSMATLIALTVARNAAVGPTARKTGLAGAPAPLIAYTSMEAHSSVARAMELLGLGNAALRSIPVDTDFRMDPVVLRERLLRDRANGDHPFAVIATAGTVNTGAIDPIDAIAKLCTDQQVWLHVDGAFGALAALSDTLRPRLAGIERADSIAFDFHKWLHVPYDAGCVLVRDGAAHRGAFASRPTYLASNARGLAAGEPWPCDFGPELSRGFRALKVWFTLKEHGTHKLAASIEDNCRLARLLGERIAAEPNLELLAPVNLNVACFRVRADELSPDQLDALNEAIVAELQERGIAAPSTTRIAGRLAIRVNITNHRTRDADIQILLDALQVIAAELLASHRAAVLPTAPGTSPEAAPGSLPFACLQVLDEALSRPEIAVASSGIAVMARPALGAKPFSVSAGGALHLHPAGLCDPIASAVLIRHGAEISRHAQGRGQADPALFAACALLAARTAGCSLALLPEAERAQARHSLPADLLAAYDQLARPLGPVDIARLASPQTTVVATALVMSGASRESVDTFARSTALRVKAVNLFAQGMNLAVPAEHLLTHGGDTRIKVDPRTGRNGYGSSARPVVGEIEFSSSTATCVSLDAYAAVEDLRRRLLSEATTFEAEIERIRQGVLTQSGASGAAGTQVVLAASGTDTELATIALSMAFDDRPITSIIVSPEETGSGVPLATLGRNFSSETALGAKALPGGPIEGLAGDRVCSVNIAIRDTHGRARSLTAIRDEVTNACETAIAQGRRVLLHVLDAAKTGIGAPALNDVAELKDRFGESIDVVVDACQARLGPEAVVAYLAQGWLVQMTGSKFWGGPPFSGALLVPAAFLPRSARLGPMLAALSGYMARCEWPTAFGASRLSLPDAENLGLAARWQAALCEADRFKSIAPEEATRLTRIFMATVRQAMASYPELLPVDGLPIEHLPICVNDTWKDLRTIVPFVPARKAAGELTPLTLDEAKRLHQGLARDVSARLSGIGLADDELRRAAQPCHLGQPVKMGTPTGGGTGALRICASMRTLAALDRPDGVEHLARDLATALAKTRLLIDHLDRL